LHLYWKCSKSVNENHLSKLNNFSFVEDNRSLSYLNISWNLIRSYASIALFRGLEVNKSVTELDLSWSGLSYDGSVALRRVLLI